MGFVYWLSYFSFFLVAKPILLWTEIYSMYKEFDGKA